MADERDREGRTEVPEYPLNYGWAYREDGTPIDFWPWATLRVRLAGPDLDAVCEVVSSWLGAMPRDEVDGRYRVHGGARMSPVTRAEAHVEVEISSGGQDAFDSIHWYANELRDRAADSGVVTAIGWTELPLEELGAPQDGAR